MLGWCIVTLASARLKASVRFPPLRGMYQRGSTCKGCDRAKASGSEQFVLITKKCLVQYSHSTKFVVPISTPQLLFYTLNQKI